MDSIIRKRTQPPHKQPQAKPEPKVKSWQSHLAVAAVLVVSALGLVVPQLLQRGTPSGYTLSAAAHSLVGDSRDDTKDYLKQDAKTKAFNFQPPQIDTTNTEHYGRNTDVYSASLSDHASGGITYTDSSSDIAITTRPQFFTAAAQKVDGDHIVYPSGGNTKLVYTLKYNGLKEDIVVASAASAQSQYKFQLVLPSGVEARLDSSGNIGIYSADPSLYGNISYGSDADRAKVEAARQNGPKTNLVATIPSPIVKDATGHEYTDRASFELGKPTVEKSQQKSSPNVPSEVQKQLADQTSHTVYDVTIVTRNLSKLPYPISIDPTITSTSASDFLSGNVNGVDVDSGNALIRRASLSGGSVGTWTAATNAFTTGRQDHGTVVYNGFLYIIGGSSGSGNLADVQYTDVSAGSIGNSWSTATSITGARNGLAAVAYNGYMYISGGFGPSPGATVPQNDVQYAPINANGSLGSWNTTSAFTTTRFRHQMVAYNGYLYITGGCTFTGGGCFFANGGSFLGDTQMAHINADGTIGAWSSTGSADYSVSGNATRESFGVAVYNNFIYIVGGCINIFACGSSGSTNTIIYAPISTNGTIGSWLLSSTVLPTTTATNVSVAANGYLYNIGGADTTTNPLTSTEYMAINADGSLGNLKQSSTMTTGRDDAAIAYYAGHIYVTGGCNSSGSCSGTPIASSESVAINTAGAINNQAFVNSANTFANASYLHSSTVLNGFLYVIGGCTATDCGTITNTVRYAALGTDGTIGAFTTDGDVLPKTLFGQTSFSNAGYIYAIGGCSAVTSGNCSTFENTIYYSLIGASGNPGAWSTDSTGLFTTGRYGLKGVAYNGIAYITGGCSASSGGACSTFLNDTWRAPFNSTGDLGTFAVDDTFNTSRMEHDAVAYNGYLYIVGGYNGSYLNSVEYSKLDANGNVNPYTTNAGTSFTTGRYGLSAVIDRGYMYVVGGCSATASSRCSTFQSDVQYAPVANDGSIGTWASTQGILAGASGLTAYADAGFIHVVGGCTAASSGSSFLSCSTINNQVQIQEINNGGPGITGTLSTTSNGAIASGHANGATVAANGSLFWIGGRTSGAMATDVYKAAIAANGTVGSWSTTTAQLSTGVMQFGVAVSGNFIYIAGGCTNTACTTRVSTILVGTISGGDITSWASSGGALSASRVDLGLAASSGYLYAVGGREAGGLVTTVESTTIGSNGQLGGTLSTSGNGQLATARSQHAVVANRGFIYALGGCINTTCTATTDETASVEFASLNAATGAVGTFATTTAMPVPRAFGPVAVALNGYMYLVGGDTGSTDVATVYYAPIESSGLLGTWQVAGALATARRWPGVTVSNGNVYCVGGVTSGGTYQTSAERAVLQSIPRAGSFSRISDFLVPIKPTKLILHGGGQVGVTLGTSYSNSNESAVTFPTPAVGTNPGFGGTASTPITLQGTNATLGRYFFVRFNLDDSTASAFPDAGDETTVTDYDVVLTPNPAKRLRNGHSFVNSKDRGLQVSPP